MGSPSNSEGPPSYQHVLSGSQERLQQNNAPYNAPAVPLTVLKFGNQPVAMNCPYCGYAIITVIEEENGVLPFVLCILIALVGLFCGFCLIPFCISDLKDKIHLCPKCRKPVGKNRLL